MLVKSAGTVCKIAAGTVACCNRGGVLRSGS